jgi:GNAT superfamily N-acetyltransferase
MITVAPVPADRLNAVAAFYETVGYGKSPRETDTVLGAFAQGRMVGAVRLSPESGVLVLRGMYVEAPSRRRGIGRQMLEAADGEIGSRECWCVPHAHLEDFYSRIGFQKCGSDTAPDFLRTRLREYRQCGRRVVIMRRKAGFRRNPEPAGRARFPRPKDTTGYP